MHQKGPLYHYFKTYFLICTLPLHTVDSNDRIAHWHCTKVMATPQLTAGQLARTHQPTAYTQSQCILIT